MVFKSPFPPVPISKESFPEKLLGAIWKHGELNPTKHALVHSVSSYLRERGFSVGDVACVVLSNCIEWPIIQLGVMAAGGVISGASAIFTDYELERQFLDSRGSYVFTDDTVLEKVMKAVEKCDTVQRIICIRTSHFKSLPQLSRIVDWAQVISTPPQRDIVRVDCESVALLPYSSGTTGSPKGVMLSHRNIGASIDIFIDHYNREIYSVIEPTYHEWCNERNILNLPFYHILGFLLLNISLFTGATSIVMSKFDIKTFFAALEKYRPRSLVTVPPILIVLAKHPMVKDFDCSSIELVTCGAAPMGKDVCMEFLTRHKNVKYLVQGYGMTECGITHLPTLNVEVSFVGIGKSVANSEQKIIDTNGNEVGIGESGELCVRSPTVMIGYLNRPEATAETIDENGWLHTGDVGYMEKDGRTFIVDRLKELIKVNGLQVPPAELEDLLLSHPMIRDAAVIGIPDTRMGELVRAYVVRANESLSEQDVVNFVAQKVSKYKHITGGVKFVSEVPKSPSGKILRRFLRDEIAKEMKTKI